MRAPAVPRVLPACVLGVAPAERGAEPWSPDSPSGRRLAELAGLSPDGLRAVLRLDNLVSYPDPARSSLRRAGKAYEFDLSLRYVLAGTEVVRALGPRALCGRDSRRLPWHRSGPGVLEWYESAEGVVMAVLPHPSGRNRWYNDARCRGAAERFLRKVVAEIGGAP